MNVGLVIRKRRDLLLFAECVKERLKQFYIQNGPDEGCSLAIAIYSRDIS
jgi:hypothetical protein